MKSSLCLLATLITIAADASSIRGAPAVKTLVDAEHTERRLRKVCSAGKNELVFFKVETTVVPSDNTITCDADDQKKFGQLINEVLRKYGITESKDNDDATLVGKVCVQPTDADSAPARRDLQEGDDDDDSGSGVWFYVGGGACSFCNEDNSDDRRKLQTDVFGSSQPEGFNAVANTMDTKLESSLQAELSTYLPCAGANATVSVVITQETVSNLGGVFACNDLSEMKVLNIIDSIETANSLLRVKSPVLTADAALAATP